MIVEWIPQNEYAEKHIPAPVPAKNFIPEWYKNIPPFESGHTPVISNNRANATAKLCMPLMDSFSTGYIQSTWCDIFVQKTNDGLRLFQANESQPMFKAGYESDPEKIICPPGYVDISSSWWTQWEPRTPKGWSTLYTHPLNNYSQPFYTMSGIIDTDKWWLGGSVPFFIQEGFEGLIPAGTPMYQIIFIKREKWESKKTKYSHDSIKTLYDSVFNSFYGGYRKLKWSKKQYE